MSLSYDDIAEILKIIDASSCDELIVETGDLKLVLRRNGAGWLLARRKIILDQNVLLSKNLTFFI